MYWSLRVVRQREESQSAMLMVPAEQTAKVYSTALTEAEAVLEAE